MIRLRTFLFVLISLVVASAIGWVAFRTKTVLASGFSELEAKQLERVTSNIKAIIKSKRDYLDNFMPLLIKDKGLTEVFVMSCMTMDWIPLHQKLNSMRKDGKFDLVDIIRPNHSGMLLKDPAENARLFEVAHRENERFVLLEVEGHPAVARVEYLSEGKRRALLVLGYALTEPVEKRIAELTGTAVRFSLRSKGVPLSDREFSMYESNGKVLVATIELDRRVFNSINAAVGEDLFWVSCLCLFAIAMIIFIGVELGFVREFQELARDMNGSAVQLEAGVLPSARKRRAILYESQTIQNAFVKLSSSLKDYARRAQEESARAGEAEKEAALGFQAKQFAHDIRSPLNAFDMVLKSIKGLGRSDKKLLSQCALRIQEVGDSILKRAPQDAVEITSSGEVSSEDLVLLISSVMQEKKIQYRNRKNLQFTFDSSPEGFPTLADVSPSDFKRVLSNLIDNAVEATDDRGLVIISLSQDSNGHISIRICDDGKGIPAELCSMIGNRGFTYGKIGGSGLGVYSSKEKVRKWGGELTLESNFGNGTTVTLRLPHSQAHGRARNAGR